MANNENYEKLRLLFLITSQKMSTKVGTLFAENAVPVHYRAIAMGTATSEVLDILGLGTQEKRLFLSVLQKDKADAMLLKIHKALKIGTVNSGIAYTVPINGASKVAFRMLGAIQSTNNQSTTKETASMNEKNNAMIVAIINRGYSEDVMSAARKAGAGGGTVVNSRSVVDESAIQNLGVGFGEEKELVLIVADAKTKLAIMQAISESCGINSEAKGIVYSLPIDNVIGLSD